MSTEKIKIKNLPIFAERGLYWSVLRVGDIAQIRRSTDNYRGHNHAEVTAQS